MNLPATCILTGLLYAGGASVRSAAAQHPDLSGRWKFNVVQSDPTPDWTQVGDTSGGERRGSHQPGMGGGRGGSGGRRGSYGGEGGGERGERGERGEGSTAGGMSETQRHGISQTIQLASRAPAVFTIALTDSTVTVTETSAQARVFRTDGRQHQQPADSAGHGAVEITTYWQGNALVVERQVSGGGKVTEDYFRSQDGKQLFVIVSVDTGLHAIAFRRVYDAAPSQEP